MLIRIPGGTPTLKGRVWYSENLNLTPKVDESSVVKFYFRLKIVLADLPVSS